MKEQFNDLCAKVAKGLGDWERDLAVRSVGDGTRLLFLRIENRTASNQPIILTIHNKHGKISVWTFYEQLDI